MEVRETRESSAVFFGQRRADEPIIFQTRKFELSKTITATPFKGLARLGHRRMYDVLKGLYREHCKQVKRFRLEEEEPKPEKQRLSRAQKINERRNLIATIIARQPFIKIKQICRISGCCYSMVKRILLEREFSGTIPQFVYPNLKRPEELRRFEESVYHLQGSFKTLADLKRENPTCSRKWIAKRLHEAGFRWRMLVKQPKKEIKERPDAKLVVKVICHLTQALSSPKAVVIYVDEAHFPLFQTSERRWTLGLHQADMIYNRRVFPEAKLSVVAACDLQGFVAIQIFKRDVTGMDFLHLMQAVMERYTSQDQVTVLADQATWHTTPRVLNTKAGSFIHLNVPGLFRVNAIENSFSFVRSEFRKRPLVNSFEEEAALLVNIFFHRENARRFEGIHKNHLRQLLILLRENSTAFEDDNDSILDEL